MHEVRGAIDGIDDEAVIRVLPLGTALLLTEEAIGGPRLGEFLAQHAFTLLVGSGDEIARTLLRHLQAGHLAVVPLHAAGGLAHGIDHDGHHGRTGHG